MALNPHVTAAARQAMLNAAFGSAGSLGASGLLRIYDATGTGQPATPETAVTTQVLLATLTINTTFAAASGSNPASSVAATITSGVAAATGTAVWFRLLTSGGTAIMDGTVGTSACDLTINSTAISSGATVS